MGNKTVNAKPTRKSLSFWGNVMKRLRKNRLAIYASRILMFLALVAIFADFIAYNKPYYAEYNGETYFPLVNDYLSDLGLYQWESELIHIEWGDLEKKGELENSFWPPIRFLPGDLDYDNQRLLSPFDDQQVSDWTFWHYCGTDRDGRDVLSGLIHGTRISLSIGLIAMGIAAFLGILIGAVAGYFGDNRLQLSRIGIFFLVIGVFIGFFYGFQVRGYVLRDALQEGGASIILQIFLSLFIMVGIMVLSAFLSKPFSRIPWLGTKKYLWMDIVISRFMEIWSSVPVLLLLITISAITEQKSIYLLILIMGIFGWSGVARFMRGEMLRTRSQLYIEAARSLGFKEFRVMFKHAIPNSLAPVLIIIAFGVAGAIVAEASLSFLGVGVPSDLITWGKLLREASQEISAWWLIVFPGFAVFLTVTCLNLLGEGLRDAIDPKTQDN